jgi:magnesium chelatase subunit D
VIDPVATALSLLAVDPIGLGGAVVQGGAGGWSPAWVTAFVARMPEPHRVRRVPAGIAEERLIGGLDLSATLLLGRPVLEPGLCSVADGAALIVPMAERLSPGAASLLAQVMDERMVRIERDGLSLTTSAEIALLLLDESEPDEAPVTAALRDRLAFHGALPHAPPDAMASIAAITAARALLPRVVADAESASTLVGVAEAFGVASVRAPLLAVRAARAHAALGGRVEVTEEDVTVAAALVLAPRATRLPAPEEDANDPVPPPPPEDAPSPEQASATPDEQRALEDRILEATAAALPADLLAHLATTGSSQDRAGRAGSDSIEGARGRRRGSRRGTLSRGKRLDLLATIRAAVPWQKLRGRASPSDRLAVRPDDFRVVRRVRPAGTTTIVLVDASGSTALHRLQEAKGAVSLLLSESYVRRDEVALITFRGTVADVVLPPTRALARARRALSGLPGGGGTPIASALDAALVLALRVRRGGGRPGIVILSDGKANVPRAGTGGRPVAHAEAMDAGQRLAREGVPSVWLDVGPRPSAQAAELAHAMRAQYFPLPAADAVRIAGAARLALEGGTARVA